MDTFRALSDGLSLLQASGVPPGAPEAERKDWMSMSKPSLPVAEPVQPTFQPAGDAGIAGVLVIGTEHIVSVTGLDLSAPRFVDAARAGAVLECECPPIVVADLGLLAQSPCGLEVQRTLRLLAMQGKVSVTWVRSE